MLERFRVAFRGTRLDLLAQLLNCGVAHDTNLRAQINCTFVSYLKRVSARLFGQTVPPRVSPKVSPRVSDRIICMTLGEIFRDSFSYAFHFRVQVRKFSLYPCVGEGSLPWDTFCFQIFLNYLPQKFENIKIMVWISDDLTMYGNFRLDFYEGC